MSGGGRQRRRFRSDRAAKRFASTHPADQPLE
jgi:hypothetical protein